MELFRGNIQGRLACLRSNRRPRVLTIGNFDGVHLGHQAILRQVIERALAEGWTSQVLVFEPQPIEFFTKMPTNLSEPPPRLMSWREKYRMLSTYGVAELSLLKFDDALSALSPESFVEQVLLEALDVRHLIVGEDFRFGAGRAGDLSFLIEQGRQKGFEVEKADTYRLEAGQLDQKSALDVSLDSVPERRVSSTWIRSALQEGDIELASRLIGRTYELSGRVIKGQQLGRTWGFPTANVRLSIYPALSGVFAVSVIELGRSSQKGVAQGNEYFGVANLGRRPTICGKNLSLEAHLFDFEGNLYGKHLCVRFHHKIRDEKKFHHKDALIEAIRADHKQAKKYWQSRVL